MTRVTTILCAVDTRGSDAAVETLGHAVEEHSPDVIVLVGDLSSGGAPAGYRKSLYALARTGLPAYWVPGPGDAPLGAYVREAMTIERVHPTLHGVHGTGALDAGSHIVFAGVGGLIDDDPEAARDEQERLRYPRIEAEYRLRVIDEFGEHERVLLFWSPPAHRGLDPSGSEAVAELINTYRPRVAVCAGARGSEQLGKTLVVAPGSLCHGFYALVDLQRRRVVFPEPAAVAGP